MKLDKSKDTKDSQAANIPYIDVTFEVSKFDTSKEVNTTNSLNINSIFVTLEVSKLDISNISKDLQ